MRLVAWKLVEQNDIELEKATPERRYEAVLAWVNEQLGAEADMRATTEPGAGVELGAPQE